MPQCIAAHFTWVGMSAKCYWLASIGVYCCRFSLSLSFLSLSQSSFELHQHYYYCSPWVSFLNGIIGYSSASKKKEMHLTLEFVINWTLNRSRLLSAAPVRPCLSCQHKQRSENGSLYIRFFFPPFCMCFQILHRSNVFWKRNPVSAPLIMDLTYYILRPNFLEWRARKRLTLDSRQDIGGRWHWASLVSCDDGQDEMTERQTVRAAITASADTEFKQSDAIKENPALWSQPEQWAINLSQVFFNCLFFQ